MIKRVFLLLLTLIGVGCGNNPTTPTAPVPPLAPPAPFTPPPPPEPELQDVTMIFVMPWPKNEGPAVENASITCLEGCPDSQVRTTDSSGSVTFLDVYPPLLIEARKDGYITRQVSGVRNNNKVVLSHVWPDEVEGTFGRLQISDKTILHWGENDDLVKRDVWGSYKTHTIAVRDIPGREYMLHVLEHELYHVHQDGEVPGPISRWYESDEGKAYIEALEADRKANRLLPYIDSDEYLKKPHENAADVYAWWAGEREDFFPREDLCIIAKARCRFMEDHYGPRPDGYP